MAGPSLSLSPQSRVGLLEQARSQIVSADAAAADDQYLGAWGDPGIELTSLAWTGAGWRV